jgi:VIT1/CCC1 family predicted Fe2+/Mn2+ transporter
LRRSHYLCANSAFTQVGWSHGVKEVYKRNLHHKSHRAGWLRAAVLGANDGLVSTASLMIGVAAAREIKVSW